MKRRSFNFAALLSAVLAVALVVLWASNHNRRTLVNFDAATWGIGTEAHNGGVRFSFATWKTVGDRGFYVDHHEYPLSDDLGEVADIYYRAAGMAFDYKRVNWAGGSWCGLRLPFWLLLLMTLVLPGIWMHRRRRLQHPPGHCPTCGYDLRATPDRCPECGHTIASSGTLSS